MNGVRSPSTTAFVYVEPMSGINLSAVSQLIPNNTLTLVNLWQYPTGGGFNTGQFNPTTGGYRIPSVGFYTIIAYVVFDIDSTGTRLAQFDINDAPINTVEINAVSGDNTIVKVSGGAYYLFPGDEVTVKVKQTSGGVLAITSDTTLSILRQSKNV